MIELVTFDDEHVDIALPWFDDEQTRRWLGGRDWLIRSRQLARTQVGTIFRGALQTGSHAWLARNVDGIPVGYIACAIYDRWTRYGGEGPDGPIILRAIERPAAALTIVVGPAHRRRRYGCTMLRTLIDNPTLAEVEVFGGGVDAANIASIKCLEAAGFQREDDDPDFEGMLYYLLRRAS